MSDEKKLGPLSTMHLRCASALWRGQVEGENLPWSLDLEIPQSVFDEAAVVLETLLKPSTEMVKAMIAPIMAQVAPWDPNIVNVAKVAGASAAGQWVDGVKATLGRIAEPSKGKPKLITHQGGRA